MRSPVDFVNLQVDNITPDRYSTGVNVYTTIQVTFNSELNVNTIFGNVLLLRDRRREYTNEKTLSLGNFERVECKVEYKDKVVILTPINQLDEKSRYIVYIPKKSVEDFKGRVLMFDEISYFDTALCGCEEQQCQVIYPENNSVVKNLDRVELLNNGADRYIVQISKNKDFDIGVYEKIVSNCNFTDNFNIGDGSYYIRAKATNGNWGDITFFTIHSAETSMINETDIETFQYEVVEDNSLKQTQAFPEITNNVSVKTNLSYIKLNKIIDIEDIDFYDSGLFEKHVTDDNFSLDSIDGVFITVQDFKEKSTYVSFIPEDI